MAAGSGLTTAILKPELIPDALKFGASSKSEETLLQQLVEELRRSPPPQEHHHPTINVLSGDAGKTSSNTTILSAAALGTAGVVCIYLYSTGWSVSDLFYTTRREFRTSIARVYSSLSSLATQVTDVKLRLEARFKELAGKQDHMIANQQEFASRLEQLDRNIDDVHSALYHLRSNLRDLAAAQTHGSRGIQIICQSISDIMEQTGMTESSVHAQLVDYCTQATPNTNTAHNTGEDYVSYFHDQQQQQHHRYGEHINPVMMMASGPQYQQQPRSVFNQKYGRQDQQGHRSAGGMMGPSPSSSRSSSMPVAAEEEEQHHQARGGEGGGESRRQLGSKPVVLSFGKGAPQF